MKKTITFLLLTILSITATGKEIIWENPTDLQTSSELKIVAPVMRDSLKLYVDIFDGSFEKPKIINNALLYFDNTRTQKGYLGTVKFDEKTLQKEKTIFL